MNPGTANPSALTPDCVLDALESVRLHGDARLQVLGSHENRVCQIGMGDARPIVAKFCRPGRWSYEAIGEEYGFVTRLRSARSPSSRRSRHRSGRITTHYSAAELQSLLEAANRVCDEGSRKTPALVMLKRKAPARVAASA